jgi:hypothetical protein
MPPENKRIEITINTAIPDNASFNDLSIPAG